MLVLAGKRGTIDALAWQAGCTHRALLPVAGVPMLLRVVRVLRASNARGAVAISIDDPAALAGLDELAELVEAGELQFHCSAASPSLSVVDYLDSLSQGPPLLVTTADHPLLTAAMIDHFCAAAAQSTADLVVGLVPGPIVREQYPEARRTFIALGRESFCGANLFAFRSRRASRVAAFWKDAERFRKRPWRLISLFGAANLTRFLLRRLDLDAAFERASDVIGARIEAVRMPFAECAIDVDSAGDYAVVKRVLEQPRPA